MKTHSYVDAPFSNAAPKRPIVFFSPSSGGFRSQNTFLTEYLVSNGYVVVGFDHPDTSSRIVFPDGYIAHSLPDTWVNISSRATLARSEAKTENIMETNVRDMQFVTDAFQNVKPGTPLGRFSEKMDFDHAAAIGHSFGGAAAAELCRIDSRFKTGLNMDGWMFGPINERGVGKPFLFMVEGYPLAAPDAGPFEDNENGIGRMGDRQFYDAIQTSLTRSGGCAIRLIGGNHGSFSDLVLFQREWPWRRSEDLDPAIAHQVVTEIVKAFLDQYLKGESSEMKVVTSRYARFIEARCFSTAPRM